LKNSGVEYGYLFAWSLNQRRTLPFKRTSPFGLT
jgi:hypothetical protein